MPYPNEHACHIRDDAGYKKVRRENKQGKTPDMIYGIKGPKESEVISFRFPISRFTAAEARDFCKRNKGRFEKAKGTKEHLENLLMQVVKEWLNCRYGKTYHSFKEVPDLKETVEGFEMAEKKSQSGLLRENGIQIIQESGNLQGITIKRDEPWEYNGQKGRGIIENVSFAGAISKNKRRYTDPAMEDADQRQVYASKKLFFRHQDASGNIKQDFFGRTANPFYDRFKGKQRGKILVVNHHDTIFNLAEGASDLLGFSHEAHCNWKKREDGWIDVTKINEVYRICLEDFAGTNTGFYEGQENMGITVVNNLGAEDDMIETVEQFEEKYPGLAAEFEAKIKGEVNTKVLEKQLEAEKKEKEKLKEEIKSFKEESQKQKTTEVLEKLLKESQLNDKNKERIRERAKGKVITEDVLKTEIHEIEEICRSALEGVRGGNIPETKIKEGEKETVEEFAKESVERLFGLPPLKEAEEKK